MVLHGGPGASHDYLLPQYDLLAQGRSLFYYDQRGGGQSPVSRDLPMGWREHVADLDAIRAQLSLERLTLCGYSWGGLLAVLYFLEYPERIERSAAGKFRFVVNECNDLPFMGSEQLLGSPDHPLIGATREIDA